MERNEREEKLVRLPLHYGIFCQTCGLLLALHEQHPCQMPAVDAQQAEELEMVFV